MLALRLLLGHKFASPKWTKIHCVITYLGSGSGDDTRQKKLLDIVKSVTKQVVNSVQVKKPALDSDVVRHYSSFTSTSNIFVHEHAAVIGSRWLTEPTWLSL